MEDLGILEALPARGPGSGSLSEQSHRFPCIHEKFPLGLCSKARELFLFVINYLFLEVVLRDDDEFTQAMSTPKQFLEEL
jgi:hypothetical protein